MSPTDIIEVIADHPIVEQVVAAGQYVLEIKESPVSVLEVVTAGPPGVKGNTGAQGEQGETGPSPEFSQTFATAIEVWVINHPLNAHPAVTTVDMNGMEIIGDVEFPDNDTVIVTFGMPVAGIARLKA